MPAMQPPAIKSDDVSKDEFTGRMAGNPPVNPASAGYDERFPRNNCCRGMPRIHRSRRPGVPPSARLE